MSSSGSEPYALPSARWGQRAPPRNESLRLSGVAPRSPGVLRGEGMKDRFARLTHRRHVGGDGQDATSRRRLRAGGQVNTRPAVGYPGASSGASRPSDRCAERVRGIAGANAASLPAGGGAKGDQGCGEWPRLRFKMTARPAAPDRSSFNRFGARVAAGERQRGGPAFARGLLHSRAIGCHDRDIESHAALRSPAQSDSRNCHGGGPCAKPDAGRLAHDGGQ